MNRTSPRTSLLSSSLPLAALLLAAACGGGGSTATGVKGTGGELLVLKTEPQDNGRLYLNEALRIDFTNVIDLTTVDLNSFTFIVGDLSGKALQEAVVGQFRLATSPGDESPGRRLEFVPRLPTNDVYDDGGFKPGRRYSVQLVGGDGVSTAVIRDERGKALRAPVSFTFSTATGTSPSLLFKDTKQGGPRQHRNAQGQFDGFSVQPGGTTAAALSLLSQPPLEIRLRFDQALNPSSTNVPRNADPDPTKRDLTKRGRVFLEYDDPDPLKGKSVWIPATVIFAVNSIEGAELVLRPIGVLPNNASVRVIVDNTLEDISGESNTKDAAYDRYFGTFQTSSTYAPQFDGVVESFDLETSIDKQAPFLEPQAEIGQGFLRSAFQFEGISTPLDYETGKSEEFLNTDFTQITPKGAPPISVSGGVFSFQNITFPQNTTVRGSGSNPMVWLATGDVTINGNLIVSGSNGENANKINSANIPTAGGAGNCGGGSGGKGSPSTTGPDAVGGDGQGPGGTIGGGGKGGQQSCLTSCNRGSGGGGGSYATQGDPFWYTKSNGSGFVQQKGIGGFGCVGASTAATRSLPGGNPGPSVFTDTRSDNNYWGQGVDLNRQIRIAGEFAVPIGGEGGGSGGDRSPVCGTNSGWQNDYRGGGGGGGGGVLIIKALGSIKIGATGHVRADGGLGGGGEPGAGNGGGTNVGAGGGGGGSGGMVVLIAGKTIEWVAHGETYANKDGDFAISADGGICAQDAFGGTAISNKYQGLPATPLAGSVYDANPTGGFGGLGIVQLMAPPGTNTDGTNTRLDDNIIIRKSGSALTGTEKQRYLAWRGFPDGIGGFANDAGAAVNIGDSEGDVRPAPLLMPSPLGPKSKARSKWIDTGASIRRETQIGGDGQPRGIEARTGENSYRSGPEYSFYGTADGTTTYAGYAAYVQQSGGGILPDYAVPTELAGVMPAAVASASSSETYQGRPAYVVDLKAPVLGAIDNRYASLRAELLDANGTKLGEMRILGHQLGAKGDRVWLTVLDGALPTGIAQLRVIRKFFEVVTDGAPGFGRTYVAGGHEVPLANVRIGFAFHKDATRALTKGMDTNRYPEAVGTFLYDLPSIAETIRTQQMPYVTWEVEFNTLFSEDSGQANLTNEPIRLTDPRPELHFVVIPYRF